VCVDLDVRFWGECVAKLFLRPKQATLIQEWMQPRNIDSDTAQSDSIIARSQCSKEFCNTFRCKADIALKWPNVPLWVVVSTGRRNTGVKSLPMRSYSAINGR
jgi:hypothetical protein